MVANIIFGLGGGSDFSSACLIAAVETENEKARDDIIILTAFAPIVIGGAIDLSQSIHKYTGMPYFVKTADKLTTSKAYEVPSRSLFPKEFALCVESLRSLIISNLSTDISPQILAVDTGGDCLRRLVNGMGDQDISHLFGGVVDTRDTDSLHLITEINGRPTVEITIFGPGADGETTALGLQLATEDLIKNKTASSSSNVKLLEWGNISNKYSSGFQRVAAWANPSRGSTISHIMKAIASCEDNTIEIERQGQVVSAVPAKFLASFWRVSVSF
eukprot:gene33672-43519_t